MKLFQTKHILKALVIVLLNKYHEDRDAILSKKIIRKPNIDYGFGNSSCEI